MKTNSYHYYRNQKKKKKTKQKNKKQKQNNTKKVFGNGNRMKRGEKIKWVVYNGGKNGASQQRHNTTERLLSLCWKAEYKDLTDRFLNVFKQNHN